MTVFAFWFDSNKEQHYPFLGIRELYAGRVTVAARYSGNYHIRSSGKIIISPGTEETVGVPPVVDYVLRSKWNSLLIRMCVQYMYPYINPSVPRGLI